MTVTVKVEPLDKDIEVILRDDLSSQARSGLVAQAAREALVEAEQVNAAALGHVPPHETFVDGSRSDAIEQVRPDGVIVYEFELIEEVFAWIDDQLTRHSPVGEGRDQHPGLYKKSHVLLADGDEVDVAAPPPNANEYVFVNTQPYARKIEKGQSPQFPDGVYEAVAALARARFGNLAKISFTYRSVSGGAIGAYAATKAAGRHAERHSRRGNRAGQWLTQQPAIIITVR